MLFRPTASMPKAHCIHETCGTFRRFWNALMLLEVLCQKSYVRSFILELPALGTLAQLDPANSRRFTIAWATEHGECGRFIDYHFTFLLASLVLFNNWAIINLCYQLNRECNLVATTLQAQWRGAFQHSCERGLLTMAIALANDCNKFAERRPWHRVRLSFYHR